MLKKDKTKTPETLQFAVYGGISGMFGLLAIVILFFMSPDCKSNLSNNLAITVIAIILSIIAILFGFKAKTKEGKLVILLGIFVMILVVIAYLVSIIPCMID